LLARQAPGGTMKITKKIGMILLSAFLVVYGLSLLIELKFNGLHIVLGILAIAAGALILVER
jgi:hypothetical protein